MVVCWQIGLFGAHYEITRSAESCQLFIICGRESVYITIHIPYPQYLVLWVVLLQYLIYLICDVIVASFCMCA